MPKEILKQSIGELKTHLNDEPPITPADKDALSDLAARLDVMISGSSEHWEEGLVEELEKQVIQYEEAHPVIARVISQIITTLNGMGL